MDAFDVLDWRRQVNALYAAVRSAEGHRRWRDGRDTLMQRHAASPLLPEDREGFTGLPVAAYDPAWRFELPVEPAEPETWEVATGTDGTVAFERLGVAPVPGVGSLDVWRLTSYGGGVFVPLKDASAGKPGGTYGGGRYLLDTVKGADLGGSTRTSGERTLVLDLNFAYNPSCAYDPAWACPLAPLGNIVDVEVPVGELSPGG